VDFVDLFPFAPEVGYLSLALVNFIGSLVPFVPLPGFLLLATMSVGDQFDLHVVGQYYLQLLQLLQNKLFSMLVMVGEKSLTKKLEKE